VTTVNLRSIFAAHLTCVPFQLLLGQKQVGARDDGEGGAVYPPNMDTNTMIVHLVSTLLTGRLLRYDGSQLMLEDE
jgi:hypothetical protein